MHIRVTTLGRNPTLHISSPLVVCVKGRAMGTRIVTPFPERGASAQCTEGTTTGGPRAGAQEGEGNA